jgi:Uma2 family endonuclease
MATHVPKDVQEVDVAEAERLITGEELAAMGDIGPCELVRGRIVKMIPTGDEHGGVEALLVARLVNFVYSNKLGRVRSGEVGIYTQRRPDTVRGADALFISNERYAKKTKAAFLEIAPDLVVEILSPSNTWTEITEKLREYFVIGVRLVWVVAPTSRSVFVYRALTAVRELAADAELPGEDVLPGFTVPVAQLFED